MKVCITQIGARNHYLTAEVLDQAEQLAALHTDAHIADNSWLKRLVALLPALNRGLVRTLLSRHSQLDPALVHAYPAAAMLTLLRRTALRYPHLTESIDLRLARLLARKTSAAGFSSADTVYGYSGGSAALFRAAKTRGLFTVLDQASATLVTSTRLMTEAAKKWDSTALAQTGAMAGYRREEQEELALADLIIAPSSFVRDSLIESGVSENRIEIIPYGFKIDPQVVRSDASHTGPLRLLFVGTANLQKGLPVLLSALQQLPESALELRIIGANLIGHLPIATASSNVTYYGRIPRTDVDAHYEWADVLVLPSFSEGMPIVQLEALAKGVPVVRSQNTGDVVRDGIEGLVVTTGSDTELAEALKKLAGDRNLVNALSANAVDRASAFSIEHYADRLVAVLQDRARRAAC